MPSAMSHSAAPPPATSRWSAVIDDAARSAVRSASRSETAAAIRQAASTGAFRHCPTSLPGAILDRVSGELARDAAVLALGSNACREVLDKPPVPLNRHVADERAHAAARPCARALLAPRAHACVLAALNSTPSRNPQ